MANNPSKQTELHKQIDFLFERARRKCACLQDAEDLTEDTLLAALVWIEKGREITHLRAFLCRVMDRRWSDMLRRRYRHPVLPLDDGFDLPDGEDAFQEIEKTDEAEAVRREIAHLSRLYREVIVRHYMNGEDVQTIARALGLPVGTVKSRLSSGREKIKKGLSSMENYEKQSYAPIKLHVTNSGNWGLNGEPGSLVNDDLLVQNLLWLAYEKPVTVEELSKGLGVPAAYVEPVADRLTRAELMKAVGNRVYTDFLITSSEDENRYIPDQLALVKEHFGVFWDAIDGELAKIRASRWFGIDAQTIDSLELYFAFRCLDYGIYDATCQVLGEYQSFPARPDGGCWIAFGHLNPMMPGFRYQGLSYSYSGWRSAALEKYDGNRRITLQIYGADCFPTYAYFRFPEGMRVKKGVAIDDVYAELLYLIHAGADMEKTRFDPEYLKAIPHLVRCRLLRTEDGKPRCNLPVLDGEAYKMLLDHANAAIAKMTEGLIRLLKDYYPGRGTKLPPHLHSVPKQKEYLAAGCALVVATIREAMVRGRLTDGHYDDDSHGVNQNPPAMVLVIEK